MTEGPGTVTITAPSRGPSEDPAVTDAGKTEKTEQTEQTAAKPDAVTDSEEKKSEKEQEQGLLNAN